MAPWEKHLPHSDANLVAYVHYLAPECTQYEVIYFKSELAHTRV